MNKELLEAFIPYYKEYLERHKERILERDLPDRPSWERLTSDSYAQDILHDMILITLYEGIVKGRQWE